MSIKIAFHKLKQTIKHKLIIIQINKNNYVNF